MGTAYWSSKTVFEVSRERSQAIKVTREVRQEDPLSTLLFSMVVDRRLPSEVGYTIQETKSNGLAYADDIVLYALPHDTPIGCFYARCRDGGLNIASFVTSSAGMILHRLTAMSEYTSATARDTFSHPIVIKPMR